MDEKKLIAASLKTVPSERQYNWMKLELTAFVHFSLNTYYDKEWGDGTEDPIRFNPVKCDTDSWCKLLAECGFKLAILTCKHHGGFCLWPSRYTEYSVKNTPWKDGKGDLVREFSDSCRKYGLKFGVYLSPWDRHDPRYAVDSPAYNQYFLDQLTELLTGYGPVAEVWFDGACVPVNNMIQEYAWEDYYALIRKLQPEAVISGIAPDVRWCGNEAGRARPSEWAVIDLDCGYYCYNRMHCKDENIGKPGSNPVWYPAEVDTSIRPNWFYHKSDDVDVKSLHKMLNIYFNSVGHNAVLLLNLPPDMDGLINPADEKRLREMRAWLDEAFETDLAEKGILQRESVQEQGNYIREVYSLTLAQECTFDCVELGEDIRLSQRVESYDIYAETAGVRQLAASGFSVGNKELKRLEQPVRSSKLYFEFISRGEVKLLPVKLYLLPEFPEEETGTADLYFWNSLYEVPAGQGGEPLNVRQTDIPYESCPGDMPQYMTLTPKTDPIDIQGVAILPHQDKTVDGIPQVCAIEITRNGRDWETIYSGELGNLVENRVFCKVFFDQYHYGVTGLRLKVEKTFGKENYFKLQRLLPILIPKNTAK